MAFQVKIDFKPYNNDDNEKPQDNDAKADENIDLSKVPKRLRQRYHDFFITAETAQPITRPGVYHAIELKPGIEPPQMRTYNLSPAELKALEDYINEALAKGQI